MKNRDEIIAAVRAGLAATLELDPESITLRSSLIDDLGAESIDLLDFSYRMERVFDVRIPDEEMFEGQIDLQGEGLIEAGQVTEAGMTKLRSALPDFDPDRFEGGVIYTSDLPRLMTVETLVRYFERKLRDGPKP
jgi:acyl carrier protein